MEWLTYLLKVSACLGLFYAFYHFCLQKLTFFSLNRIYLLGTLLVSFIIPALQLQIEKSSNVPAQNRPPVAAAHASNLTDLGNQQPAHNPSMIQEAKGLSIANWQQIIFTGYWLIAIVMLVAFASQSMQLLKYTRRVNRRIGRLKIVFKPEGFTNCSFLNYVFVNEQELTDQEMAVILQHENVHVSRYHSLDKLFITTCKILLWFNPFIYLYSKALEQVHEYEADKETSLIIGNAPYASLLLAIAIRKNNPALVNSFVKNPLKGRIKMLFTNQSKNMKKLAYFASLPIGIVLTWMFAVQVVYAKYKITAPEQVLHSERPTTELPVLSRPLQDSKTLIPSAAAITDTLRMIDNPVLGKNPEVIIDGKKYNADILTKISPRCITATSVYSGKIEITTRDNKIEYATATDIENVKIRNKAAALKLLYVRYTVKNEDGSDYDEAQVKLNNSSGSVDLPTGSKLLFIVDGKHYTEEEAKKLSAGDLEDMTMVSVCNIEANNVHANAELKAKYGNEYDAVIEISKNAGQSIAEPKEVPRKRVELETEGDYGSVFYTAKDSVRYNENLRYLILYGGATIKNDKFRIFADRVRFDGIFQIAYAKNASFTTTEKSDPVTANFVKFDFKKGTYEFLDKIEGF